MRHTKEIYEEYARMRGMIVFILRKLPGKLNRVALCKNLYYSEMHYFQKHGKTISGVDYLHIEAAVPERPAGMLPDFSARIGDDHGTPIQLQHVGDDEPRGLARPRRRHEDEVTERMIGGDAVAVPVQDEPRLAVRDVPHGLEEALEAGALGRIRGREQDALEQLTRAPGHEAQDRREAEGVAGQLDAERHDDEEHEDEDGVGDHGRFSRWWWNRSKMRA